MSRLEVMMMMAVISSTKKEDVTLMMGVGIV
jgi:hypothetical protein